LPALQLAAQSAGTVTVTEADGHLAAANGTPVVAAISESDDRDVTPPPVPFAPSRTDNDPKGWTFAFSPYVFLAEFKGTVGARGRTIEIDSGEGSGSALDHLDFALMGTFEARKSKFILLTDMMWVRLSAEGDTRGGLFGNAQVGANMVILDPEAGYRIFESKAGSVDLLGGARIWSVENTLTVTPGTLPGFEAAQRKSWLAPVAGVRGVLDLSPKFFLTGKADAGAGWGTHSTSQLFGGAGVRIKPWVAILGGYRYLQVDHDDDSGFIFDTQMRGVMIGGKFTF
jgi:hypothetical protein